ncbi:helix-turn-helix domain-containing protein [Segeticoccus rhizosphaerae]|uniref:helix-turn-helix domain-containing protein n=1 Tax=Segeticoccus rhizosphaerae TaxID=1104777 RepID=UPI001EE42E6D|nr:helix-turn-helix domain-containing protein [Ornithinicoccus soli]
MTGPADEPEPPSRTLLRLLAAGARPEQLAAVEGDAEAREDALVVRGVFDAHRRRESELAALVDTARDLAAAQDPAGVLEAIVRRARALLGTDVAYLTLYDPARGDTFMRTTDGSVSIAFQNVRLSLGDGLGGLAASTHKPYWTADYMADGRFNHTRSIDGAVNDEGLVAICGTPLLVEEAFVGVLFAANRTPRPFTREEVALLGSLAALAAVSLVQTRAAAETTQALAALSAAHETVGRYTAGVERAAAAHDSFTKIVLAGGGVEDLTAALGDLLDASVTFLDAESTDDTCPPSMLDVVSATHATGRLAHDGSRWAVTVSAGPEVLGTLVLERGGDLDDADERTIERAALVTALILLFARAEADAEQRASSDLVADLMTGRGDLASRTARARGRRLDPDEPHVVLVVRGAGDQPRRSLVLSTQSALDGAGLVGEHDGDVVAVIGAGEAGPPARQVAQRLGRRARVTVGAAGPTSELAALPDLHAEAARTVAALTALGREGDGAAAADLGFAGLVVGSSPQIGLFVDTVLGPVADYDRRRRTELLTTLEAYFAAGCSPRHAADSLHVHVNTVAQRIERISALLGSDWQQPERSLEIQLALRLRRLLPDA